MWAAPAAERQLDRGLLHPGRVAAADPQPAGLRPLRRARRAGAAHWLTGARPSRALPGSGWAARMPPWSSGGAGSRWRTGCGLRPACSCRKGRRRGGWRRWCWRRCRTARTTPPRRTGRSTSGLRGVRGCGGPGRPAGDGVVGRGGDRRVPGERASRPVPGDRLAGRPVVVDRVGRDVRDQLLGVAGCSLESSQTCANVRAREWGSRGQVGEQPVPPSG